MKIRCPNCGRMGSLPDHLAPEAYSLRCRRCSAHFLTSAFGTKGVEPRLIGAVEPPATGRTPGAGSPFLTDGFFAGLDEAEPAPAGLDPGDSHYELTFTLPDARGDAGPDGPTESGDGSAGDEPPSGEFVAPLPGPEAAPPDPWPYRFLDSAGPLLFFGTLGFAVLALPVLGFVLGRLLGGGPGSGATTPALIVGSLAAIAFLLISVAITALNVLLVDLARNLRRLRDHADRKAGIVRG